MDSITINELLNKNKGIIIDIRSYASYLQNHIPGAISIEEKDLYYNPEKYLSISDIYYLYCSSGVRSKILSNRLNRLGYNTVNIVGGFHHYLLNK